MRVIISVTVICVALFEVMASKNPEETATAGPIPTTTMKFQLNIRGSSTPLCKNENGTEGYCLMYTLCNANKTILLYGDPDENDLRSDEKCAEFHHFCCVLEGPWKEDGNRQVLDDPACSTAAEASDTNCPWCVSLYKDGGSPGFRNPSGLFCGGVLLGEELVLTTASCVRATRNQNVWASIESERNKFYNITFSVTHPKYNSATREFDYALLELSEKVSSPKPACVQRQGPRADALCRTFGHDDQDNLIMNEIKLEKNRCGSDDPEPESSGAACGTPLDAAACQVTLGTPVLCPFHQGGYALWGLAQSSCRQGFSHLGYFSTVESWAKPFLAVKPSQMEEKIKSIKKSKK